MTDNEIIQILKNHIEAEDCVSCESFGKCDEFLITLITEKVLDFITRQQAEIDKLNAENMLTISERNAFRTSFYDVLKQLKTAKAETVKEFAEKLKNEIISDTGYGCDCNQHSGYYDYKIKIGDIPEYIDNLVKEIIGE